LVDRHEYSNVNAKADFFQNIFSFLWVAHHVSSKISSWPCPTKRFLKNFFHLVQLLQQSFISVIFSFFPSFSLDKLWFYTAGLEVDIVRNVVSIYNCL
jgi:hypothetical protein